jgi:signal transduction histidine kinase
LGLALVERLVEFHGGKIWLQTGAGALPPSFPPSRQSNGPHEFPWTFLKNIQEELKYSGYNLSKTTQGEIR